MYTQNTCTSQKVLKTDLKSFPTELFKLILSKTTLYLDSTIETITGIIIMRRMGWQWHVIRTLQNQDVFTTVRLFWHGLCAFMFSLALKYIHVHVMNRKLIQLKWYVKENVLFCLANRYLKSNLLGLWTIRIIATNWEIANGFSLHVARVVNTYSHWWCWSRSQVNK